MIGFSELNKFHEIDRSFKGLKAMCCMGHMTKYLLIFRDYLCPHEKRYLFEILEN